MLVMPKELKRIRGATKISQSLFRSYAQAYCEALHQFLGLEPIIVLASKTNSVYFRPPCAEISVRISDHYKHGRFHQVVIKGRHPKDDDLAQEIDRALRNCYRDHHGRLPSWKEIQECCTQKTM